MRSIFILSLIIFFHHVSGQQLQLCKNAAPANVSIRGLSVVSDSIAWISGTNGYTGRSTNGGKDWVFTQVKNFEKADFRTLYAFNAKTAIIANAGSPASILITDDGGQSWKAVYTNTDSAAFFDGIDFWSDKEGIIYGDPIQGKMLLLRTGDGGRSWKEMRSESPAFSEGEASFAASGTSIRCKGNNKVIIASGGKISRLWISADRGMHWNNVKTPITQGLKSTGIFSVACRDERTWIITGGDYLKDTLAVNHIFYTVNAGKNWLYPSRPTRGYRECVEYISNKKLIAAGPRGTDISNDGGIHWQALSDETGFHVVRKARNGSLVIIAGSKGKIGILK